MLIMPMVMLFAGHRLQILQSVVVFDTVAMMDDMAIWDRAMSGAPHKTVLRLIAMALAGFWGNEEMDVAMLVNMASALPSPVTFSTEFPYPLFLSTATASL